MKKMILGILCLFSLPIFAHGGVVVIPQRHAAIIDAIGGVIDNLQADPNTTLDAYGPVALTIKNFENTPGVADLEETNRQVEALHDRLKDLFEADISDRINDITTVFREMERRSRNRETIVDVLNHMPDAEQVIANLEATIGQSGIPYSVRLTRRITCLRDRLKALFKRSLRMLNMETATLNGNMNGWAALSLEEKRAHIERYNFLNAVWNSLHIAPVEKTQEQQQTLVNIHATLAGIILQMVI